MEEQTGVIHSDLSIGADVTAVEKLQANAGIASPGFKLHGKGFIVKPSELDSLGPAREGFDNTFARTAMAVTSLRVREVCT